LSFFSPPRNTGFGGRGNPQRLLQSATPFARGLDGNALRFATKKVFVE
jgi:hypothetical protein